jgi:hypothetical protein
MRPADEGATPAAAQIHRRITRTAGSQPVTTCLRDRRRRFMDKLETVLRQHGRQDVFGVVAEPTIPPLPDVAADWRAQAEQQAAVGLPINQARRERADGGYPVANGLTFGSQAEVVVYELLVELQRACSRHRAIAVMPLPAAKLRDAGVRTPDFVVLGNGRAVVWSSGNTTAAAPRQTMKPTATVAGTPVTTYNAKRAATTRDEPRTRWSVGRSSVWCPGAVHTASAPIAGPRSTCPAPSTQGASTVGVWGARPPNMMTGDPVRALRGQTSPEPVPPVRFERTLDGF